MLRLSNAENLKSEINTRWKCSVIIDPRIFNKVSVDLRLKMYVMSHLKMYRVMKYTEEISTFAIINKTEFQVLIF